jgi:hypothetical protein
MSVFLFREHHNHSDFVTPLQEDMVGKFREALLILVEWILGRHRIKR